MKTILTLSISSYIRYRYRYQNTKITNAYKNNAGLTYIHCWYYLFYRVHAQYKPLSSPYESQTCAHESRPFQMHINQSCWNVCFIVEWEFPWSSRDARSWWYEVRLIDHKPISLTSDQFTMHFEKTHTTANIFSICRFPVASTGMNLVFNTDEQHNFSCVRTNSRQNQLHTPPRHNSIKSYSI